MIDLIAFLTVWIFPWSPFSGATAHLTRITPGLNMKRAVCEANRDYRKTESGRGLLLFRLQSVWQKDFPGAVSSNLQSCVILVTLFSRKPARRCTWKFPQQHPASRSNVPVGVREQELHLVWLNIHQAATGTDWRLLKESILKVQPEMHVPGFCSSSVRVFTTYTYM